MLLNLSLIIISKLIVSDPIYSASNQASYTRLTNDDLLITLNTGAEITIKQHYAADNAHRIESIQFADAAIDTTTLNGLLPTIANASQGNDVLKHKASNDNEWSLTA